MYILSKALIFPPVKLADDNGLLALGGDLSAERLQLAYRSGIFPWYNEGAPICWYSPKRRMVLFPEKLRISKSMRKILRNNDFRLSFNQDFAAVISECKAIRRKGQSGTWITTEMQAAYEQLHELGIAKSVEVWKGDALVGGLYGIDLGTVFCGESMFSKVSNASKVGFICWVQQLAQEGYTLIDCQVYNDHLASLGAEEISQDLFLSYLPNP
ncbi:MAG: leucyl/phenylalanyl-tRNA--protein transferase [Lutibacter sp.]|jgi:leucyl/phenylalanyl-tRNA--protein transferase|nr:leucyl/phenylalanyl-tRNA--protein transferase [Lutibacter sp.]